MTEDDEGDRIRRGAPVWVEFLRDQLHPFLVEVGHPPASAGPELRLEVDLSNAVPAFQAYVTGVDDDDAHDFVAGCIEALQKMLDAGLTPPPAT